MNFVQFRRQERFFSNNNKKYNEQGTLLLSNPSKGAIESLVTGKGNMNI